MEIHHHSHIASGEAHTPRKKWTHYFWEFLMLFLAVFCGFLAENRREHMIEHKREKQFIKTLAEDIHIDTSSLNATANAFTSINNHIDSLIPLLKDNSNMEKNAIAIYRHAVWLQTFYKVTYYHRTIEQLKSSGNFRLIRNKNVSRSIMEYDGAMRDNVIDMQDKYIHERKEIILNLSNEIFKTKVSLKWFIDDGGIGQPILPDAPYFLTKDKEIINKFINHLYQYKLAISWFILTIRNWASVKAVQLDSLIKKEYHLK